MSLEWLFTWWNAVYSVPLAFVLLFLGVTSLVGLVGGALGELGHGHDHGTDLHAGHGHDHGTDLHAGQGHDHGADLHAGHDHGAAGAPGHDHGMDLLTGPDVGVDASQDLVAHGHGEGLGRHHHDAHGGHPEGPGPVVAALLFLGAGRAPLLMLLQILVLLWGLIGINLHQALGVAGPLALLWSIPLTLLLSVLGTRGFALLFGRFIKPFETSSLRRHQIVGRTGQVIYDVGEDAGTIHVRDEHGTLHRVRARAAHGSLERGREIIVVGYDADRNLYQVDDASAFVDRA